jgi:hypothetical protein
VFCAKTRDLSGSVLQTGLSNIVAVEDSIAWSALCHYQLRSSSKSKVVTPTIIAIETNGPGESTHYRDSVVFFPNIHFPPSDDKFVFDLRIICVCVDD